MWAKAMSFIADNVSPQQYKVWFEAITPVSFANGELRLGVPSSYFAEHLEERFLDLIEATIKKVYGGNVVLYYCYNTVKDQPDTAINMRASDQSSTIIKDTKSAPANPFADQLPRRFESQLNSHYNFENYCAGSSNNIARTIAESIANDPSNKTFNPLFVFGPVGVGKTHLIQAVGVRIKERNPEARVLYVTARLFQSQFTAANHKGQINNFYHFYQSIDTLIVDDIQDLSGKPETQNTFFNIFNQLHQNNRQIIMSSDCPPSEMDGFTERLLSRFKWGASVSLDKPDIDLRRRVLVKKAQQSGLQLPDDVIEYVAEHVTDSIRELEGIVASMVAQATVLNCDIDIDLARPVVAHAIRMRRSQVNFDMIADAVAAHYKINSDLLFTKTRKREVSDARQMVMYLAKKLAGMSLKNIGNKLGRTHATVIYACRNIEERVSVERGLRDEIETIKQAVMA